MTRPVTLAHLTAVELPPPALIRLAAETGYDGVGLRLIRVTPTTPGYPLWEDPGLLAKTEAALAETGMTVGDVEFVRLTPEFDLDALAPFFETGARLGAKTAIAAPYDPDLSRLQDSLGRMAEASAAHGLVTALEFFPWTEIATFEDALRVTEGTGAQLLFDALHFDRSGGDAAAIRPEDAARIALFHLCDAPRCGPYSTEQLLFTAREARLAPGTGEIDLAGMLAALPEGVPVGIETPMDAVLAAEGPRAVALKAREGAQALGL